MDNLTLHVERGHFIPDNFTLALCATGDHAYRLTPYLAHCDPDTMRLLLTELSARRATADVTEAMVERALAAQWKAQGLGWNQHNAMKSALLAAKTHQWGGRDGEADEQCLH